MNCAACSCALPSTTEVPPDDCLGGVDADADAAYSGGDLTTEKHEITLSEEVVDVDKRVVANERVRLETDVETDDVSRHRRHPQGAHREGERARSRRAVGPTAVE